MNLPPQWAEPLRAAGHDAVHWIDIGACTAPDGELMRVAREQGRVVLTQDLDFGHILAATSARTPSVVQVRLQEVLTDQMLIPVLEVLDNCRERLLAGALVSVTRDRSRVRVLPLTERPDVEG